MFCNIFLYEVVIKLIVICFEKNITCSLNVNKRYLRVFSCGQRNPGFWGVTQFGI